MLPKCPFSILHIKNDEINVCDEIHLRVISQLFHDFLNVLDCAVSPEDYYITF